MVILIFIFLTPNHWFTGGERVQGTVHQSAVAKTLVLTPEVVGNEQDRGQIEQRVKGLTGRSEVEVLAVRKILDANGKTLSFEVDIR